MDEATPRGIIRGVLTTTSVSKSARTLRPRTMPRAANAREAPVNPPSRAEVASRLLTRSRSANKRKATARGTPSDSTTPRTLIAGFLQTAPVAKSVVKGKKPKKVKSDASETSTATGTTSLHEDNTPRTTIQNLLHEALTETPEEPIFSPASGVEDEDIPPQTDEVETQSPLTTSTAPDDDNTDPVKQPVAMTTVHQTDDVMAMEASSRLQDSYQEGEGATQHEYFSGYETQELDSLPMVTLDQALQTDTVIRGDAAVQISGQWRDLVTPELPLDMSTAGRRQLSRSQVDVTERSAGEKKFFGGKPPAGKTTAKSLKKPSGPRMPTALVKNIFQHFSKAKLSKEALQAVENGSNLFFKQVSSDLMAYCQHAHRTTIELTDVELLMKRQGFITEHQSLYSLVEKYLPLEYRQEIIPTAQAGNKIILK